MKYPDTIFQTSSLNLASYLLVNSFELLGKEPDLIDIRRVLFVFQDRQDRESLATSFLTGHGGNVNVHRFLEAQKQLKNLLKETRDSF